MSGHVCRLVCACAMALVMVGSVGSAVSAVATSSALQSSDDDDTPEPPEIDAEPTAEATEEVDPPEPPDDDDDDSSNTNTNTNSDGNSYTDNEYGWAITWDDTWNQTADPDADGYLGLENGTSSVFASVLFETDSAQDCIRDQVVLLTDGDATSSVSRLLQEGDVVRGGDETAAYAAYRYNFKTTNASVKMVSYFDCRVLPSGDETLLTSQVVVQDAYAGEAEGFQDLLAGLTVGDQEADGSDDGGTSGNNSNSYTNEDLGYSLSWDDSWTREEGASDDELKLTNDVSVITLLPFASGDARDCTEGSAEGQDADYVVVQVAMNMDDEQLVGGDADYAYAIYIATNGDGDQDILFYECTSLDDDNSLLVHHVTSATAYNDEIAKRLSLLENLDLGD